MPWEVFNKPQRSGREKSAAAYPFVTLTTRKLFSLNRAAYEQLGQPEMVELLYDRENKRVAFKPAPVGSLRAFKVTRSSGVYNVAARGFVKHYGIDTKIARRYGSKLEDGLLVIDLQSEWADASGPRAKSRGDKKGQS